MAWRFGTKKRTYLFLRERDNAFFAGLGNDPICNICGQPVKPGQAWDESHDPGKARALGGRDVGIAHRDCNRKHGAKVVTPMVAKAKAQHAYHVGIKGPGLGKYPMAGGRRSKISKTVSGRVVPRLSLPEKLAQMRAKRAIGNEETTEANPRLPVARLPDFPFEAQDGHSNAR